MTTHPRCSALIALSLLAITMSATSAQPVAWKDSSPHQVRFIEVEPGVRLEVLDWGGQGTPLVLLAGYNTAHAYDEFAPKLAQFCHVYGITRRGYGVSSRTDSGYAAERSAQDVLQVLDALKLVRPVLMGHSFGGQDLSSLGAAHIRPAARVDLSEFSGGPDPRVSVAQRAARRSPRSDEGAPEGGLQLVSSLS